MLTLTCERAQIEDGMDILDLGCGWGSLSLWLGEHYPNARVTGITASVPQREHIEAECERRGITNVEIVTSDANRYDPGRDVDRVLSVEMFEHMRNWKELLRRISGRGSSPTAQGVRAPVLAPQPRLPLRGHLGGRALLRRRHDAARTTCCCASRRICVVEDRWAVSGTHYARTLQRLARAPRRQLRRQALAVLERHSSAREARRQLAAWRLFMFSAAEIWGLHDGSEWLVSHYLLKRLERSAELAAWTHRAKE